MGMETNTQIESSLDRDRKRGDIKTVLKIVARLTPLNLWKCLTNVLKANLTESDFRF